jgi:hypothetical protein
VRKATYRIAANDIDPVTGRFFIPTDVDGNEAVRYACSEHQPSVSDDIWDEFGGANTVPLAAIFDAQG